MNAHQISLSIYNNVGMSRGNFQPTSRALTKNVEKLTDTQAIGIQKPQKVLFIDTDGLNAAPAAAGFYDYFCQTNASLCATINTQTPKLYNHPSTPMIKGMARRNISIEHHVPQLLRQAMLKEVDVIVVLCNEFFLPDFIQKFNGLIIHHQILIPRDIDDKYAKQVIPEMEAFVVSLFHNQLKLK